MSINLIQLFVNRMIHMTKCPAWICTITLSHLGQYTRCVGSIYYAVTIRFFLSWKAQWCMSIDVQIYIQFCLQKYCPGIQYELDWVLLLLFILSLACSPALHNGQSLFSRILRSNTIPHLLQTCIFWLKTVSCITII